MPHVPRVPPDDAEQIRRWHERAYEEAPATEQTFDYLGLTLDVPPEVQPINGMSHLLGEAVLAETREEDRVLDMGTGSGVNAILAARRARYVLAVDNNPVAVNAARANAWRNAVQVDVRESDVFSAVEGEFDLIVFDPPFRWFAPRDLRETATTDQDYRALTTFFAHVREHLAPGGRILLFFGTSGDAPYLHERIAAAGLLAETIATADLVRDGWRVEYFTLRLQLPPVHSSSLRS